MSVGPISVSFRQKSALAQEPLRENMVISNEPGYYERGQFGIRIENLCIIRKQPTPYTFDNLSFLGFETITLVPIQKKLMKTEDMTPAEITWINNYHAEVFAKLADKLSAEARDWLQESTSPL